MGVLDITGRVRRKSRGDYDFDVIGWEDFVDERELESEIEPEQEITGLSVVDRCSRLRKKGRATGTGDLAKRKKGVRSKRRYENMCYLLSLVDDLDQNDTDDIIDHPMTAFADLFMDANKMKLWNEFINLSEDQQQKYLDHHADHQMQKKKPPHQATCAKLTGDHKRCHHSFLAVDQKIKDYLRSKDLAKELLKEYEADILSTVEDCPQSVLVLNVASSYGRVLIHGICQYAKLKAMTHKQGPECLMEIEARSEGYQCLPLTLTEYLDMFR